MSTAEPPLLAPTTGHSSCLPAPGGPRSAILVSCCFPLCSVHRNLNLYKTCCILGPSLCLQVHFGHRLTTAPPARVPAAPLINSNQRTALRRGASLLTPGPPSGTHHAWEGFLLPSFPSQPAAGSVQPQGAGRQRPLCQPPPVPFAPKPPHALAHLLSALLSPPHGLPPPHLPRGAAPRRHHSHHSRPAHPEPPPAGGAGGCPGGGGAGVAAPRRGSHFCFCPNREEAGRRRPPTGVLPLRASPACLRRRRRGSVPSLLAPRASTSPGDQLPAAASPQGRAPVPFSRPCPPRRAPMRGLVAEAPVRSRCLCALGDH